MKFLNYLGDFCEHFTYIIKNIMPYFVVMVCLNYFGLDWLIFVFIGLAVYLTIVNFEYNELKRQCEKLQKERNILELELEILKKEIGESK